MAKNKAALDIDEQFRKAAQEYWRIREDHRRLDAQINTLLIGEEDRGTLRSAWRASSRAKMRGISNRVARFNLVGTTTAACEALARNQNPEVEHAVPVNIIHNWILGIDRSGNETAHVQPIRDMDGVEKIIRAFVVGVYVTPEEHSALASQSMPEGSDPLSLENRMGRYNNLAIHKIGECAHCRAVAGA